MAIWISWNIDIRRSLNSRGSFPRRKFKNRAPTSCSPCPILSPPIIIFQLHAKTAEEIDLEKCNFRNFGSSMTLTLDRSRSHWCAYLVQVYLKTKLDRNRKNFLWTYRPTDTPEFQSTNLILCDPCLSALYVPWCEKALYKYSSFPFPFLYQVIAWRWPRWPKNPNTSTFAKYLHWVLLTTLLLVDHTKTLNNIWRNLRHFLQSEITYFRSFHLGRCHK